MTELGKLDCVSVFHLPTYSHELLTSVWYLKNQIQTPQPGVEDLPPCVQTSFLDLSLLIPCHALQVWVTPDHSLRLAPTFFQAFAQAVPVTWNLFLSSLPGKPPVWFKKKKTTQSDCVTSLFKISVFPHHLMWWRPSFLTSNRGSSCSGSHWPPGSPLPLSSPT